MELLNLELRKLQEDLAEATKEKVTYDAKLVELDELVSHLLHLNECLVGRLSGKSKSFVFAPPKSVLASSASKKKKSALPRAASLSTASFDAGKYDWGKAHQTISINLEDIEQLRKMHDMYRGMAKSIIGGNKGGSANSSRSSSAKRSTRMGRRKEEQQLRARDSSRDRSRSLSASRGVTFDSTFRMDDSALGLDPNDSAHGGNVTNESEARHMGGGSRRDGDRDRDSFSSSLRGGGRESGVGGGGAGSSVLRRASDLHGVISSLEEEFDSLNAQYRHLLSSANTHSPAENPSQADELVAVIQKLQRKGEQLRALKSPGGP